MDTYYTRSPLKIGDETQMSTGDTIIEDCWRLQRVREVRVAYA